MASIQKKVEWTEEAKEDYREMVSFLYDTWSEEHADRFAEAVEAMTQLLTTMPEYGTPSRKLSAIRRVLIRPYTPLLTSSRATPSLCSTCVTPAGKILVCFDCR